MGTGSVQRVSTSAPVETGAETGLATLREIIAAVRSLSGSELLGQERELRHRRNRQGRLVIELVDRETGDVLGELPPDQVLRMVEELHRERQETEL